MVMIYQVRVTYINGVTLELQIYVYQVNWVFYVLYLVVVLVG